MDRLIVTLSIIFACQVAKALNNYETALQKSGEALYIQTGLNKMIDARVEEIRNSLPPYCKKTIEIIVPIVDTIVKQRVELRYEF